MLMCWRAPDNPLPVRFIHAKRRIGPLQEAPPWHVTGAKQEPFDFGGHIRRLVQNVVARCQSLAHIDPDRILVGVTQARNQRRHGLQARVTPLRFAQGQLTRRRHGVTYRVQRYFLDDHEFLYLLTFCLPRFLDQDFTDKFITLFHELYHISPACDGDLRRHDGRYAIHSHSQRDFDSHMAGLAREYLAGRPNPDLHAFLRLNFAQLVHRHGSVAGVVVPRPRLIPVEVTDGAAGLRIMERGVAHGG
jgi:hypothetical protein